MFRLLRNKAPRFRRDVALQRLYENGAPLRFWELDALRGFAILLMVAYHLVFDLHYFFGINTISVDTLFWRTEGLLAATLFIALTGIVSALIHQQDPAMAWKKNFKRGLRLIGLGIMITLITYLFDPSHTIWFGILHFLGAGIILSVFFLKFKGSNLVFALLAIGAGKWLATLSTNHSFGLIFGLRPIGFQSFDYYPLLPWFGVMLAGIWFGQLFYAKNKPLIRRAPQKYEAPLIWIGKHSLWIYLFHQPILLGTLSILIRLL